MKMKRYGVNVRETPHTRKTEEFTKLQRSPLGLQQGWNKTPCEILPNEKNRVRVK